MAELTVTEQRLENWKNWARPHKKYRVTTSLEGRYKAPPVWHPPEAKVFVDINDALEVERAIIRLPAKYKNLIVYKYITPYLNLNGFCRKNAIRSSEYDMEERKAILMVQNRLRRMQDVEAVLQS